jgi:hypothetical protein
MDRLRDFYRFGPQRSRQLCERFDLGDSVIGQAELDDLLVLQRQDFRIGDQPRPATLSEGRDDGVILRAAAAVCDNQARTSITELSVPCGLSTFSFEYGSGKQEAWCLKLNANYVDQRGFSPPR